MDDIRMVRRRAKTHYRYGGQDIRAGDIVFMPEGASRVLLTCKFYYQNHLHEPGDIVELPKGVEGPKRVQATSVDRIDYGTQTEMDANRILGGVDEVPDYVVIEHEDVEEEQADPAPVALLEPPKREAEPPHTGEGAAEH